MKVDVKKFDFRSDIILSSLSPSERELFLQDAEPLKFKKNSLIFFDGGIPTGVFIIISGKAKIYKLGLDGKPQIFYIYKNNDLMGYHALLCNENYEDSCEVIEDCDLLFISKAQLEERMEKIPKLKLLLIQNMSHEFGVLVNTITVLAQKPLRDRLALFLLILNDRYKLESSDSVKINLPREDLANIIGTARESLGRLLKEFAEDELIIIEGRSVEILNTEQLNSIASSHYQFRK